MSAAALDRLMPMHMTVSPRGHVLHAGPALRKLIGKGDISGQRFLELFELARPRDVTSIAGLSDPGGTTLRVRLRDPARTGLKGLAMPLADGGLIVNLSLGISVIEAVGRHGLTSGDFAPTDLAIEMLYLVEAKSAVMEEFRRLNQRLQGARIAAEEQAFTDTLTGLKNRRAMDHVLDRMVEARRPFGLMHLDLDFFKDVNDTLGHAAGDHVLQTVARILVEQTRDGDTIVRAGGDEFVLILSGVTRTDRLVTIADRIIARLEEPTSFNGAPCRISGSIGVTVFDGSKSCDPDRLLADADEALYASKRAGRGCVTLHSPETGAATARSAGG